MNDLKYFSLSDSRCLQLIIRRVLTCTLKYLYITSGEKFEAVGPNLHTTHFMIMEKFSLFIKRFTKKNS